MFQDQAVPRPVETEPVSAWPDVCPGGAPGVTVGSVAHAAACETAMPPAGPTVDTGAGGETGRKCKG